MATAHRTAGAKSIISCWLDQGKMSPMVPVSITSCCFGQRSPSGFCSVLRALLLLSPTFPWSSASVASDASLLVPFLTACTCCTCLSKWSRLLNSFLHFSHTYIFVDLQQFLALRVRTWQRAAQRPTLRAVPWT